MTLNDPVYLEAAYHLAKNNRQEDIGKSIAGAYQKATLRKISPERLDALLGLYKDAHASFIDEPGALKDFVFNTAPISAELAALTIVSNAIMNLDEFLTTS